MERLSHSRVLSFVHVCELLRKKAADVNVQNSKGQSPLHIAETANQETRQNAIDWKQLHRRL
ncbi:hypothetical protein X975_10079, partial [Stegodyphus mimosarum]